MTFMQIRDFDSESEASLFHGAVCVCCDATS